MDESSIDILQTPQVTEKAEDEGGKGTQSISSICRMPEVTEKTENEGGKTIYSSSRHNRRKTIYSSMLKRGKAIFSSMLKGGKGIFPMRRPVVNLPRQKTRVEKPEITEKTEDEGGKTIDSSMQKSIDNRPGSSQPPEIANYQVAIPAQSNNVPHMFPLGLFHRLPDRPENIESLLLARDRQCNFEELVKNMIVDTPKIRKWYDGVERRLSESNTELGRMIARSGLLLLEFLRSLVDLQFDRGIIKIFDDFSVQEAVIKIGNQIPFFVLKKVLEWERDADKDENRQMGMQMGMQMVMLGSDGDADKGENRQADTDLHSILKHASLKLSPILYDDSPILYDDSLVQLKDDSHDSLKLSPILYDDSHVIAGVPLKDDSHLLEFLYENIIGSSDFKHDWLFRFLNKRCVRQFSLPQAEPLKGKGVKFAPNEGPLNKICFNRRNRRLYLPTIKMDGGTAAVLRNLVLFEASKQEKRSQPLMSYVGLMERLIDTAEDVQALRDDGIIQCHLATNIEAANVWNGMRDLLPNKKIKYEPIDKAIYDVRRLYTSKCRIMYTEFKQIYCSKPWIVLSVISAFILFAGLQTYLAWEKLRLQRKGISKT